MTRDVAIQSKLDSIDWSFRDSEMSAGINSLHPYPARFIAEIPRALIRLFYPGDQGAVLDPFCGSGTTLVESAFARIPSCGIELNPLAALIAKVRTTPLDASIVALGERIAEEARRSHPRIPDIPRLNHWFKPEVQSALAGLVSAIGTVREQEDRDALRVALSRIVVRVSNQESDTRYAAVEKRVDESTVYRLFLDSVAYVDEAIRKAYGWVPRPMAPRTIVNADVLSISPTDLPAQCSLAITSPPYPNAYEYWLYHKYRMYWLGMDPIYVRAREIGARPHYFKKNHQTEVDFERQMDSVFSLMGRVMSPGSLACFLVGDSIIHGRLIDNAKLLRRSAKRSGFERIAGTTREIAASRKSFNLAHARIREEKIEILRLERIAQ